MRIEVFDDLVNFLVEKSPSNEIRSLRPSSPDQESFNSLSNTVKTGTGTSYERAALELHIQLEHLVQLAKARRRVNEQNTPSASRGEYQTVIQIAPQGEEQIRQSRCEYCLLHVDDAYYAHYVDYVIAPKHEGSKGIDNLALSCAECNVRKGTDLASLTASGKLVALFNPRRQRWGAHFRVDGGTIEPLTRIGEVTARLLDFNNESRIEIRRTLAQLKLYPRR